VTALYVPHNISMLQAEDEEVFCEVFFDDSHVSVE
jgi:hypothetical protein